MAGSAPGQGAVAVPSVDVSSRCASVRSDLEEAGCDVLVVSGRSNVRWLTGFTGSTGVAVVSSDAAVLVTDARYGARAVEELERASSPFEVSVADSARDDVVGLLAGNTRLGLEAEHISWAERERWGESLDAVEIVAVGGLVERHRMVKDAAELARMRAAAGIADTALAEVLPVLSNGPAESDVAAALTEAMRGHGAEGPAFAVIVAAGPNAARPHHIPGERRIAPRELVIIDLGATVDGYRSDMTRTVCVGEPRDEDLDLFELVVAAQQAGVEAVAPQVATRDVDAACRDVIDAAGHGEEFVHGAGHGVGLDIHEAPRVSRRADETLAAGVVVTVEPGVYVAGRTGVRIEDTVVVTEDGADRLTLAPKTLCV